MRLSFNEGTGASRRTLDQGPILQVILLLSLIVFEAIFDHRQEDYEENR